MPPIKQDQMRRQLLDQLERGAAKELRTTLAKLHPADSADFIESIPREQRSFVWSNVTLEDLGEVLIELTDGVREGIVQDMDPGLLVEAIRTLDVDEIADILPELSEEVIADVLIAVDKLDVVLSYEEDTAGGLMNIDTVIVRENLSLAVVLRYLRLRGELPEYTDKLFVVDRQNHLVGTILLSTLLTMDPNDRISQHMLKEPIKFEAHTIDDEVAASFERYNLISAPVVDGENRLLGRITIDDVVDVIRDKAEHPVMARAGLKGEEDIFAPVGRSTKGRAIWLGVNLITALIASWVIGRFEHAIEQLVALAVLMPIVASMGGNAGTQTLTIVIRGISSGTINRSNAMEVLKKECMVGGLNGVIWAIVVAIIATLWYQNYALGLIIGIAMIINIVVSALAGVVVPLGFDRLGIDPALAGGVALTTITDVVGFSSILGLAAIFLI
ncbi:magnesium transporter [Pseudomonadota bacterium]